MTVRNSSADDVLVVGGGPAGAATAWHLANAGHRVTILERAALPRQKVCGDLLTPRAVRALAQIGIENDALAPFHRVEHVRLTSGDKSTSTRWPSHESIPRYGLIAPRDQVDQLMIDAAIAAGAMVLDGHEATAPIVERGFVRGAHVTDSAGSSSKIRAGFTVVADGANSRFGRSLGTFRQPTWPYALAHRAVYRSAIHGVSEIELVVDLSDKAGTQITGYGWMFPRGDGTVNVGVSMTSTSPSFRVVNPAHLLEQFVAEHANRWHLDLDPVESPAGGRIPMGNSVGPAAGPTYLLVGDAGGAANPLSGAGIEYALETGLLAGEVLDEALRTGSAAALQRYPKLLEDRYGAYYKVGRLASRMLGRPSVTRRVANLAASRPRLADAFIRISSNELRSNHTGTAELAYRLGHTISLIAPDA